MDAADRFRQRRERLKAISDETLSNLSEQVDPALVEEIRSARTKSEASRLAMENFDRAYQLDTDITVTDGEVAEYLQLIESGVDEAKFNNLITACRNDVISAIVTPFGLGGIVATFDKEGGNVDTIRNARDGVYANEREQQRYEDRGEYDATRYRQGNKEYREEFTKAWSARKEGKLEDAYTGKNLPWDQDKSLSKNKKSIPHEIDHTLSAKKIHDDPGRVLADSDGPALANHSDNLNPTERYINRAKKDKSADEFISKIGFRKDRLEKLEAKGDKSPQDIREIENTKKLLEVDTEKLREISERNQKRIDSEISKTYYTSGKFAKNVAITSSIEAGKMGLQQAFGVLLTEFFMATFDEIVDIYKHGFYGSTSNLKVLAVLQERLQRIAQRVLDKRKDICMAFGSGAISGFLSNIVTIVINVFKRTSKRVLRMIREGFFSLLRAIKLLCFPPPGMTGMQAAHEASKLIATGIVVIGGVALEQYIDTQIKALPFLEPVAGLLTAVLVGAVTGLTITLVVYWIDKLDFFKVNEAERREQIAAMISSDRDSLLAEGELLADSLEAVLL